MIKQKIAKAIYLAFMVFCIVAVIYIIVDWCDMSFRAWIIVLGLGAGALVCRA